MQETGLSPRHGAEQRCLPSNATLAVSSFLQSPEPSTSLLALWRAASSSFFQLPARFGVHSWVFWGVNP